MSADFVDYTNVTEIEKFEFKLSKLMKEIEGDLLDKNKESFGENRIGKDKYYSRNLQFRGVDFRVSKVKSLDDPILQGIPYFRFSGTLQRCFDLSQFWLLECVDKHRMVSETTGRLLLGALIQAGNFEEEMFVKLGEMDKNEKFIGFRKSEEFSEYFETFSGESNVNAVNNETFETFEPKSAQVTLEWFPNDLRMTFPGFCGYFDSWHPIGRIQLSCIWPQVPREGLGFKTDELEGAPIWIAEYEETDQTVPLRNSTLRSIQAGHLREVLFTEQGNVKLINIPAGKESKPPKLTGSIDSVYEAMSQVYLRETEKMEKDLMSRYNFIPKRVMETMRIERINEAFSGIWRRHVKFLEEAWNELKPFEWSGCLNEFEKSGAIVNWCIERELEWQRTLNEHVLLRIVYKIPLRQQYTSRIDGSITVKIDGKIEEMEGKLSSGLEEMNELKRQINGESETATAIKIATATDTCMANADASNTKTNTNTNTNTYSITNTNTITDTDTSDTDLFMDCQEMESYERKRLDCILGHVIYEPVVLNCEPPPSKLLTRSLLNTPLAGEVIALNQLREDIRVFKAWNRELCEVKCTIDQVDGKLSLSSTLDDDSGCESVDLGFIGFLKWHSPNDVEGDDDIYVSQRMRDDQGQWLNLWREINVLVTNRPLNEQVSFNHRAMLGQVMSDLTIKTDLKQLLEDATPFLTGRAAKLLGPEAVEILNRIVESEHTEVNEEEDGAGYPLDLINSDLDEHERNLTKKMALEALCSDVFTSETDRTLVSRDSQRKFLLNRVNEFQVKGKEVVRGDGREFKDLMGGFEGIRIGLDY